MRNRWVLLLDFPLVAAAALGAFALRFEWTFGVTRPEYLQYLIAAVIIKPAIFALFGMYARYWRYASALDLLLIFVGVTASSLAMASGVAVGMLAGVFVEFSRRVLIDDWLLTLLAVGGMRLSVRLTAEAMKQTRGGASGGRRVLVVGAGEAGVLVVREMNRNPQLGLTPVAFIDDDPSKRGKRILGVPVVGALSELKVASEKFGALDVVIAMPTAPGSVVRRVAEAAAALELKSLIVPGVFELLGRQVSVQRLREVEISDLLRRKPVGGVDGNTAYLRDQVVLVTGAGGSIGSELCRQIVAAEPKQLIVLGHGENSIFDLEANLRAIAPGLDIRSVIADVRHEDRLQAVFAEFHPSVVFHAAAHKHVPLMEANPGEAVTNNVVGTRNVVTCVEHFHVSRFVLISTDKAVAPSSVMGATKRVAEMIVRAAAQRNPGHFAIVRFGNVLGSRGSVVGTFKRQIAAGGPVLVTHPEMQRFFMTIPEAVHLVLEAGGLDTSGNLFVLNMGRPVRITDLALDLIKLSGAGDIQVAYTGLRPGEKMIEALFEPHAVVSDTANPDIMSVVEGTDPDPALLDAIVADMASMASLGSGADVRRLLHELVPTFETPAPSPLPANVRQ